MMGLSSVNVVASELTIRPTSILVVEDSKVTVFRVLDQSTCDDVVIICISVALNSIGIAKCLDFVRIVYRDSIPNDGKSQP